MSILTINLTRFEKPYILLIVGIMTVASSAMAISCGALDYLKTTKKGEPPPLVGTVTTFDDVFVDLRDIGCSIIESVVIKARSDEPPTMITDYNEFRSIA